MEPFNLNELLRKNSDQVNVFSDLMTSDYYNEDNRVFDKYLSLIFVTKQLVPAYIAPAYHFNNYLKDHRTFFRRMQDVSVVDDNNLLTLTNEVFIQIEFQSALYSIKILLDRMIGLFRSYYNGISPDSTFGRIKDTGKASGFMSLVMDKKSQDEFLSYVFSEYNSWIKDAVFPRDIITHKRDLSVAYRMEGDFSAPKFTPVHIVEKSDSNDIQNDSKLDVDDLKKYIDNLYSFFDNTIKWLSTNPFSTK